MEGIIMMVVVFIISSLLSGNKKKERKGMPPFSNQQNKRNLNPPPIKSGESKPTPKSLEDFANEVFQQLNDKGKPTKRGMEKAGPVKENQLTQTSKKVTTSSRPTLDVNRLSNNTLPTSKEKLTHTEFIQSREIGSYIPTNKKALVHAIIASEIIGPPKSKR